MRRRRFNESTITEDDVKNALKRVGVRPDYVSASEYDDGEFTVAVDRSRLFDGILLSGDPSNMLINLANTPGFYQSEIDDVIDFLKKLKKANFAVSSAYR